MRTLMVYSRRYRGINSPFIMVLYKSAGKGTITSTCPKQYSWVGRIAVLKPLVTFADEVCGRQRPSTYYLQSLPQSLKLAAILSAVIIFSILLIKLKLSNVKPLSS